METLGLGRFPGSATIGSWIEVQGWLGTGEGSGYGLFFIAIGRFTMPLAVDGLLYRSLRRLEVDIPDVEDLPTLVDPDTVGEMGVA